MNNSSVLSFKKKPFQHAFAWVEKKFFEKKPCAIALDKQNDKIRLKDYTHQYKVIIIHNLDNALWLLITHFQTKENHSLKYSWRNFSRKRNQMHSTWI